MKIVPLSDRVIIKRDDPEGKSKGGILLPDVAKEAPKKGKVIAVGFGKIEAGVRVAMEVKAGDSVLFSAYAGHKVIVEGEEFLIVGQDEILAILQ